MKTEPARPAKPPGSGVQAAAKSGNAGRASYLLWLLIIYLVLEYARPPVVVQFKLQMLISLVLPLLCLALIKDRRWSWTFTCQIGLLAVAATGMIYARNNYSAYLMTRILYTTIAISISMAWLLARLAFFRSAIWAWTLIMTYIGFFGIAVGGSGPGGIIGDENELALACNTAVPMAYFGAVGARGWRRLVYAGIGIVLLSAIVLSNSRGGFIGLVGIVAYIILISKNRVRATVGLAIATSIFFLVAPQSYVNEILSIEQEANGEIEDGTGDTRLFLWQAAFNMWKANPVLGVGAGNSKNHTGEFQPDWEGSIYSERDWSGTAIHSGVFELLSETGSVGVFFYAAFIINHFSVLRAVRRVVRTTRGLPKGLRDDMEMYSGALAAGMIGYIGSGLFLSVAYHPYAFYFSGLSQALAWGLEFELGRIAGVRADRAASVKQKSDPRPGASPAAPSSTSLGKELLSHRSG